MPSIKVPYVLTEEEAAELKAHHLACSQLVRGCQDAIFRFRSQAGRDIDLDGVSFRTVEIMEGILDSWCETLSILRSALNRDSARVESYDLYPDLMTKDSAQMIRRFAKSLFTSHAHVREQASGS